MKEFQVIKDGKIFTEKRLHYDPHIAHRKAKLRELNK
jgi:hypothetical protein